MKVLALVSRSGLRGRIEVALKSTQFVVDSVNSAQQCIDYSRFTTYTGILLDSVSIGCAQCLELVKQLRREQPASAIFIFQQFLELEQRLYLFEAGADECIHDPFFASELAVRLGLLVRLRQAACNQATPNEVNMLRAGDLELDLVRRQATRLGETIDLRPREFLLLEYLVRNANRPLTRTMIIEHVWNSAFEGFTNVVDVYISTLRSKMDRGFPKKLIRTTRGIGYTLVCADCALPRYNRRIS
jgi:two-component system OmpR family response regulator